MAIMVREHALRANDSMTELTEVLNFFVLMLIAENFASARLVHSNLRD